jgi:DNA-binding NarL/FixJ family response regulator
VIGVVVIADNGAALQRLSKVLSELPNVHIVRHCSGGAPVGATVAAAAPDVVLLDELRWPGMTVRRVAEIRELSRARIIVSASRLESVWLADAMQAGASAHVPQSVDARTLGILIRDVVLADALDRSMDQAAEAA